MRALHVVGVHAVGVLAAGVLAVAGCVAFTTVGEPRDAAPADRAPSAPDAPLVADGPLGGPSPGFETASGRRLKGIWRVSAEGDAVFHRWRDTMRGVDCTFRRAADGQLRCMPAPSRVERSLAFADPECTKPAIVLHRGECWRDPAIDLLVATCPATVSVLRIGPVLAQAEVHRQAPGGCAPGPVGPEADAYALEEWPPAMFVAGTLRAEAPAGGVAAVFLDAEDGARQFWTWRDARLGADCRLAVADDGEIRCLPVASATLGEFFADARCTIPAAFSFAGACGAIEFAARTRFDACPVRTTVFLGGERLAAAFRRGSGPCDPASPAEAVFAVGAEISPPSMPDGTVHTLLGRGRLRPRAHGTAAGVVPVPAFWDMRQATECVPDIASDGALRCVPAADGFAGTWFSDAGCKTPLVAVTTGACPPSFARLEDGGQCPRRRRVFPVSGRHAGTAYASTGTSCAQRPAPPELALHALAAELPASDFADLREVTR